MPRLIWSPSSRRDLANIDAFLTNQNDLAAARILRAIAKAALRLQDHPHLGREIDPQLRVLGARTTPYLLIYRLRAGNVEIVRIRHGRENWLPDPEALS